MLSPAPPLPFVAGTGFTPTLTSDYFFNDDPSVGQSPTLATQTLVLGHSQQHSPNKTRTSSISSRYDPTTLLLNKHDDYAHPATAYTDEPRQTSAVLSKPVSAEKLVSSINYNHHAIHDSDSGESSSSSTTPHATSPSLTQPKPVRPITQPPSPAHSREHRDNDSIPHHHPTAPCSPVMLSVPAPVVRPLSGQDGPTEYVGPFVLGPVLGRGCTGTVRLGTHRMTGFEVAFKIIEKKYLNGDPKLWKKVKREIAILKLIEHPHVLKLYDVLETEHRLYLVLEHVRGGELFDYIVSKGRLDRHESLRLTAQIVMGLSHCHQHSICHRDLKPENLLLDEKNNIKIADFGMAQLMKNPSSLLKTSCGSPHYASPEIIEGQNYDAKVTDVWSIGVILYALITGSLPFDHDNIPTLLSMVTKGIYSTPAHVPADVSHLISRMLTVDPKKRIRLNEIRSHPCYKGTNFFEPVRGTSWPFNTVGSDSDKKKKNGTVVVSSSSPVDNDHDDIHDSMIDNDDMDDGFVDESLINDLEALGISSVNNREELKAKVAQKLDGTDNNLERRFYEILKRRRNSRLSQLSLLSPKVSPRHLGMTSSIRYSTGSGMILPFFHRAATEPEQHFMGEKPMVNVVNESAPSSRVTSAARDVTPPLQTPEMIGAGEWVNLTMDRTAQRANDGTLSVSSTSTNETRIPISPLALDDESTHHTHANHSNYLHAPFSRLQSAPSPSTEHVDQFDTRASESAAAFYSRIASISVAQSPHSHYTSRPALPMMISDSAPSSPASGSSLISPFSTSAPPASMMAAMELEQQRRAPVPSHHAVLESRARSSSQDNQQGTSSVSRRLFVTEEKSDDSNNFELIETGSVRHSSHIASSTPHYSTTPRFHRVRLEPHNNEAMSPSSLLSNMDLGSPVKKKSWFSSIFSGNPLPLFKNSFRRASVNKVSSPPQSGKSSKPITGLYSSKTTLTVADEVRQALKANGVHYQMKKCSNAGTSKFECVVGGEDEKSAGTETDQYRSHRAKAPWSMRRFSTTAMGDNAHHEPFAQDLHGQRPGNTNRRASVGALLGWTQPTIGSAAMDATRSSPPKPPPAPRHKTRPNSPIPATTLSRALTAAATQASQPSRPAHTRHTSIQSSTRDQDHVINIPTAAGTACRLRANSAEGHDAVASPTLTPHVRFIVEITSHHTNDHRCVRFIHVSGDENAFRHWQQLIQQHIHV